MKHLHFTPDNLKVLTKISLQFTLAFLLNLFFISNIFANITHSGNSSYEDSNQDWNGDGVLDGVDKNGGAVGDKLLTWSVAAGVHIVGGFAVEEDYKLTIEPSAIVKFHYGMNSNITVYGTLIADGDENNKIIFTSMADDSYGGDTNNDGDATSPGPGNWGSINFLDNSINCILDNTIIQYAAADFWLGGTHTQIFHAILIINSNPIITNNTIQHILFHGIEAYGSEATITGNTISDVGWDGIFFKNSGASISENTITDCGGNAISINSWPEYSITTLPSFSANTFSNNTINAIYIASGNIQQNLTLEAINNPYYVYALTIDSGYTLTIKPGAILKFGWGSYGPTGIFVHGTLIADGTMDNNTIFTSILDDAYGGDTNNDADTTVAEAGNWGSIAFNEGSENSILDHSIIRFAGTENWGSYYSWYAVACSNASPIISNNTIQYGNYDGIYLHNSSPAISGNTISDFAWSGISNNVTSSPSISYNTISNNVTGIYSSRLSNPLVNNNNILNNSDFGFKNADASIMINATNNWWGDISGPYDPTDGNPDYNPDGLGNNVSDYVDYRPWSAEPFVGVAEEEIISGISLSQNFPNPFNLSTKIEYSIPTFSYVTLKIYNINSDEVICLVDGNKSPGRHSVNFDASNLSSGIYFYRLQTGNINIVKKMFLVK